MVPLLVIAAAARAQAQPEVTSFAWTGNDAGGFSLFDPRTQETELVAGTTPTSVAFSPDGSRVYTVDSSGSVSIYRPIMGTVSLIGTLPAALNNPTRIVLSADGTTAYIADTGDDEVVVINLATTVITALQDPLIADPGAMVLSPDGAYLYVATSAGQVLQIETSTNTIFNAVGVGGNATDLVVTPDGVRVFAAVPGTSRIHVIETETMTSVNFITPGGACSQLAITPDGTRIFAPMDNSFNLVAINVATETMITAVHMTVTSDQWAVDVTPDGSKVIVAGRSAEHFVVVNPVTAAYVTKVVSAPNTLVGRFLSPSYLLDISWLPLSSDADLLPYGFRDHLSMIEATVGLQAAWTTTKSLASLGATNAQPAVLDTGGFDANISGTVTGPLVKDGDGTLTLSGASGNGGELALTQGELVLSTTYAGQVSSVNGTTIRGTGTVNGLLLVDDGSTLSPGLGGPGTMTASDLSLTNGGRLDLILNSTTPGTGYSRVVVSGETSLSADSILSLTVGYLPVPGDQFTIVTNHASGQFTGRPEGAFFDIAGAMFHITYAGGGDGDDIVLTVNAAPTLGALANLPIDEDAGQQTVNLTIGDDLTAAASLTVTATSSNQALVTNAGLSLSGTGTARTLQFTPEANQSGTATITVRVTDGAGEYFERTFSVIVAAVNDAPTLVAPGPQTIDEDGTLAPVAVTVDDIDSTVGDLVLTATSSDQSLVTDGAITIGGSGANRTVALTPVADAHGSVTITLNVSDGVDDARQTFVLTVNPINDAPTVAAIGPQSVDEDMAFGPLAITVADIDNAAGTLVVTASSSNHVVVDETAPAIGGSGANRTLTLTPRPNASGTTTITVTVSDGDRQAQTTFLLTVNAVNDAPTITTVAPQTIDEDTSLAPVMFSVSDIDDDRSTLTVTASSSNQALVPDANLTVVPCANCSSADPVWTIAATPAADAFGTTTITLTVSDGDAQASTTFVLTVTDVEDPPPPTITYYLAEGATGPFFDTDLLIANPHATAVQVTITFMREDGTSVVDTRTLAPTSRTTIRVDDIEGLENSSFSTSVVSADARPLAVERTMRWDATGYGAHTEKATEGAAPVWYFAEGAQGWFSTYLLLANPQPTANSATVTWLRERETPIVRTYPLAAASRTTVDVSKDADLDGRSFGAQIVFDQPGMAERAMYFGSNPAWQGGHAAAGATATATDWYLAEGATGSYFTTFVLLANPGAQAAEVTLTYLPESGDPVSVQVPLAAGERMTRNIAEEHPSLASMSVATSVSSTQPIVVERSQYWGEPAWIESHNSTGVTTPGRHWALAEGRVGGEDGAQTYILLANPGGADAEVTLTFLRTDGTTLEKPVAVPAGRRVTVGITGDPNGLTPELTAEAFGTRIDSTRPIIVERSLYTNANGVTWVAGTNATATALPQPR